MAEEQDAFSGELFENWGAIEPGHIISPLKSSIRYRQGGDVSDWSDPGSQKFLPRDWEIQCGAMKDTFVARDSGGFEVEYPVPFADNPIFICTVTGTLPAFEEVSQLQAIPSSPAIMEVYWWSVNNITRIYINWIAIGPVGLG